MNPTNTKEAAAAGLVRVTAPDQIHAKYRGYMLRTARDSASNTMVLRAMAHAPRLPALSLESYAHAFELPMSDVATAGPGQPMGAYCTFLRRADIDNAAARFRADVDRRLYEYASEHASAMAEIAAIDAAIAGDWDSRIACLNRLGIRFEPLGSQDQRITLLRQHADRLRSDFGADWTAPPKPADGTERQKALQARGRRLFAVLQDPAAIERLAELIEVHGSERAAIEWLIHAEMSRIA